METPYSLMKVYCNNHYATKPELEVKVFAKYISYPNILVKTFMYLDCYYYDASEYHIKTSAEHGLLSRLPQQ